MSENARVLDAPENRAPFVAGAAAVIIGLAAAAWTSWTCDDAFISYRYARHLVEGNGLVFNVGERVEGYTNLLWTLWVALGMAIHVDPETWSSVFGLLSYGIVLVLALAFHFELRTRLAASRWSLPIACIALALHGDAHVFATSGLETSAFTAAAFGGYFLVTRGLVTGKARPIASGVVFGLCLMLRPDGVVFAALAAASLFVFGRRRDAGLFAAVVVAFWAGTTAFRVAYYGDWLPNTYYAKSGGRAWYAQGLSYLVAYLHKYWVLFAGAAAFAWARRALLRAPPAEDSERFERVHGVTAFAFAAVYTFYVVRVGGDFMYARLLVPAAPYLAVLSELALRRLSLSRPFVYVELVVAGALLLLFTPRPATATSWFAGIADERAHYDDRHLLERAGRAEALAGFVRGLPVTIAFLGTEARLMYEARVPVAIESETGLTDRAVARQPLETRGRIGHEKRADVPYLIRTRRAHFATARLAPELLKLAPHIPLRTIQLGPVDAFILHWDPALMAELRRRGAEFEDFPAYLDRYLAAAGSVPTDELVQDFARFRLFYFLHAGDAPRLQAFERLLAQRGASSPRK